MMFQSLSRKAPRLSTRRRGISLAASLFLGACGTAADIAMGPDIDTPSRIRYGTIAGSSYPAVVLIIMDVAGEPAYRCSGTLLAPKVVLTVSVRRRPEQY